MGLTHSPAFLEALTSIGIVTETDVLLHLPYRYDDFTLTQTPLYHDQQRLVLKAKITSTPTVFRKGNLLTVRFTIQDQHQHVLSVIAFNRPYLAKQIIPNTHVLIVGKYDQSRQMLNLITLQKDTDSAVKFKPLYRLPQTIEQYWFTRLVNKALTKIESLSFPSILPTSIIEALHLMPKKEALKVLHHPDDITQVDRAWQVFKTEEAYTFIQRMQAIREENLATMKGKTKQIDASKIETMIANLPYPLTASQHHTVQEIIRDLTNPLRMYRLLQGDVGSGKTVVATIALYANYLRKQQGALMAPTDALAKQHFLTLSSLLQGYGVRISLLVGSLPQAEKQAIKESLLHGTIDIVIGTHALFSHDTTYFDLGLAVIDEQHRFGVNQRDVLKDKGKHADLLMMSATPIPRSLAMTLYADMDVSTLTEFPYAKRKVTTTIVEEADALIDYVIAQALEKHKRIYIIAPKIIESDSGKQSVITLAKHYRTKYGSQVGLLHGQLDQDDKDQVLQDFASGKTPILVSTTVVEVGIDVKPATVMIIHDADTFGLASLHQLRGRIGRDGSEALCLLVVQSRQIEGLERLQVLVDSNDGFYIAGQDLALRGPGELLGSRQAGIPGFQYLNIVKDQKLIKEIKSFT
jgi:ATP-dependent DNA helicase RecG